MAIALGLLAALLIKHFIFDFFWQPPWMWKNKGRLGAWGGIAHSGVHALATFAILMAAHQLSATVLLFPMEGWYFGPDLAIQLVALEFVGHYFTDFAKMNINAKMGWGATTHEQFWQLTGLDQLVHQLTYLAIVWIVSPIGWAS